jgi:hypothetical protein
VFGLSVVAGAVEGQDKPATPAEQYKALVNEFYDATQVFSFKAKTDEERNEAVARVDKLRLRLLDLAEKNRKDPIAVDALVQVIQQEIWLENNTAYPGDGKDSPLVKAIALLLRDQGRSDKLGDAEKGTGPNVIRLRPNPLSFGPKTAEKRGFQRERRLLQPLSE